MHIPDDTLDCREDKAHADGVRLSRRECFDAVAALYDRGRPPYPETLIGELVQGVGLRPDSRVLEIGCGTGQLTVSLAERGASIRAVELGPRLAAIAARRLARFPRATVVVADFDTWPVPESTFDVVVAATAYHWLNPATRSARCVGALRPGGTLAIIETRWSAGSGEDAFFTRSQECYARWDPHYVAGFKPGTLGSVPPWDDEPAAAGALEPAAAGVLAPAAAGALEAVRLHRLVHERQYSAAGYCGLLGTFSDVLALDETARSGFLECIRHLIDVRFAGSLVRKDVYDLWLATRRDA